MTGDRTSWRLARFVVVDLETTGLDPRRDEVLSFAAVPIDGGRIIAGATVSGLVRPDVAPPASSIEIHGLRVARHRHRFERACERPRHVANRKPDAPRADVDREHPALHIQML